MCQHPSYASLLGGKDVRTRTDSDETMDILYHLPQDLLSPASNGNYNDVLESLTQQHHHPHQHVPQDDLHAEEYQSDEFKMYRFKVEMCSKKYVHDWRTCPFSHPTENARRRDPRIYKYVPIPCPSYKKGICLRGDSCPYSHGVYEAWLHPAKYRTQLCKEGHQCRRPVCFFAHSLEDLRQPTPILFDEDSGAEASDSKTDAMNNMSESQGNGSGSEGSSSDSGRNNCAEDNCPGTPPTRRAQAPMPTTGDVSMLGIGSPGSLISADESAETGLNGNGFGYGMNGNGFGANGNSTGVYRRRSVDYPAGAPEQQPFAAAAAAGPRMSQAVARKLGLAPSRSNSNASSMSGVVSPPRRSFDVPQRAPVDYRRSADVYLERDLLNAIAFNTERVVMPGMGVRDVRSPSPSLIHAMNGIEDTHKAAMQQTSSDSMSSLVSSLNSMAVGNQEGFSLPLSLDEFNDLSRNGYGSNGMRGF